MMYNIFNCVVLSNINSTKYRSVECRLTENLYQVLMDPYSRHICTEESDGLCNLCYVDIKV